MSGSTLRMKVKPWPVPTEVTVDLPARPKQEGMVALPKIPLEEVDADTLDALAQTWLDNLYASVRRRPPFYASAKPAQ